MTVQTKLSGVCAAIVSVSEFKELPSHRWMVEVLAEMIEYSEKHELQEVTNSLVGAIEKISPLLITPRTAQIVAIQDYEPLPGQSSANVVDFNGLALRSCDRLR